MLFFWASLSLLLLLTMSELSAFDMIKFGIIGCGDVTELKSGPAFKKVEVRVGDKWVCMGG